MSETTTPQQQDEESLVNVRHVELMEVCPGHETSGHKRKLVLLALGTEEGNGSVEYLAFTEPEALKLLGRLAFLHRRPWQPAAGCSSFCLPHSIWRAGIDLNANGFEKCLAKLIRDIPEVGEFAQRELNHIGRSIARNFKSPRTARALITRLNRSMLLAIDAARYDT